MSFRAQLGGQIRGEWISTALPSHWTKHKVKMPSPHHCSMPYLVPVNVFHGKNIEKLSDDGTTPCTYAPKELSLDLLSGKGEKRQNLFTFCPFSPKFAVLIWWVFPKWRVGLGFGDTISFPHTNASCCCCCWLTVFSYTFVENLTSEVYFFYCTPTWWSPFHTHEPPKFSQPSTLLRQWC